MARLNISLLGTFQVMLERRFISRFRSTNNQGLLVKLLLQNDKPLSRELLVALFWPEESEKNTRNNLRQSLYQLHKLLGDLDEPQQPYFLATRQIVQFNPDSDYVLDVGQFYKRLTTGIWKRPFPTITTTCSPASLVTALNLNHGCGKKESNCTIWPWR